MLLASVLAFLVFQAGIAIPFLLAEKVYSSIGAASVLLVLVAAKLLMHRGHIQEASILFTFCTWPVIAISLLFSGGARSLPVVLYVAVVALAGGLLGTGSPLLQVAVSGLLGMGLLAIEAGTALPLHLFRPGMPAGWAGLTLALLLVMTVANIAIHGLDRDLERAQRQLEEVKQAEASDARQVARLRALRGIEDAVLSSADLGTILRLLVQEMASQLHVDAVSVLFFNRETARLDFAAGAGFRTQALRYTRLPIGKGLAGEAAKERKTVHIENLAEFRTNPVLSKAISGEGFVAYYAVPLIAKDQLHGVLELFHRAPLAPDPEWVTFLETLAAHAAISIDNARLLETTQQSLKEANALYRLAQGLASSLDPEQLMRDVVELLHKDFGFQHVQIYEVDTETSSLVAGYGSGPIGAQLKAEGYRLPLGAGIAGFAADVGEPFTANNVERVTFFVPNPLLPDTQSEMAIPIKIGGQVLGVLDIQQRLPGRLTGRQMQLMEAAADQLAVALQKAKLYTNLQASLTQEKAMRAKLMQSERLALVGRLLASVSHELNNPLQAIQNALFLIKEEEQLSPQGRQDLEIVLSEAERMSGLINRLRSTYRATRSEDFHDVQLNQVVEDIGLLTATHMRRQDIQFEFLPDPKLPIVSGIPDQLRQVVLNLFMNAIEAMPSGGKLTIRTNKVARKNQVVMAFTDTGDGVDPELLPHIFDPFVSNKEKGTGLGLTITNEIIQRHQGSLLAENNPEGGATFKARLPVQRKPRK